MIHVHQVFLDNNVNGEIAALMNDEWIIWQKMGLDKFDIYKIMFYFKVMRSPGYVLTLSSDYEDECCVCSHNTPEKTIHLLREYNMDIQPALILKNNLTCPVLTFTAFWEDVLGNEILSSGGKQIMTECMKWKEIHQQHLKRLNKDI